CGEAMACSTWARLTAPVSKKGPQYSGSLIQVVSSSASSTVACRRAIVLPINIVSPPFLQCRLFWSRIMIGGRRRRNPHRCATLTHGPTHRSHSPGAHERFPSVAGDLFPGWLVGVRISSRGVVSPPGRRRTSVSPLGAAEGVGWLEEAVQDAA